MKRVRHHQASGTAVLVAAGRAIASCGQASACNPNDTIVRPMLPAALRGLVGTLTAIDHLSRPLTRALMACAGNLIDHVALRAGVIDQALHAGLAAGCEQIVVVGAGLDTRSHRLQALEGLPFYELDHPASQASKRAQIARLGDPIADVRYVPVDLAKQELAEQELAEQTPAEQELAEQELAEQELAEQELAEQTPAEQKLAEQGLAAALGRAGHDPATPTFWIWEGVIAYLAQDQAQRTLAAIAGRSAPGSQLIASYMPSDVRFPWYVGAMASATLPLLGEPLGEALSPGQMALMLQTVGFVVDWDEAPRQWFARVGRGSQPRLYEYERLVLATKERP